MALNTKQAEQIKHASKHSKTGTDPLQVTDLVGVAGAQSRLLQTSATGDITADIVAAPLFVTDTTLLAALENEANWLSSIVYTATSGYAGQRVVSVDTNYYYECIQDTKWVRYGIATTYFNMYLKDTGADLIVRQLLENEANWVNLNYAGSSIIGTYQGQAHYDQRYKFDAVEDNIWIRTPRQ